MGKFPRRNSPKAFRNVGEFFMEYISVPKTVHFDDLWKKGALSPSLYRKVVYKNSNVKAVAELIEEPIKGREVGSSSYVERSEYFFIRNRALQEISYLLQKDSQSIVSIKPKSFTDYELSKNDILYAKDSNIGECCIIESGEYKNYTISSGILKLVAKENPLYVFAFLKHPFVKSQLYTATSKGSTIRHSGLKVLSCVIPFPSTQDADEIIAYVETLTQEIVNREIAISEKDMAVHEIITDELLANQKNGVSFQHEFPTINEIETVGRLDASMYSRQYNEKIFPIINYADGFKSVTSLDFEITPGPSLELKILKTRIDSDEPRKGFYTLIIPTHISEYGTLDKIKYLGTAKEIEELQFEDILIGESGTWRSMVLLSNYPNCITNAHGSRLRHRGGNLTLSIFVRCILAWYKRIGLFDYMVVGGSGGHLSPNYFDMILIPNFPEDIQEKIAKLYYEENGDSGIAQLNEQRMILMRRLNSVLDNIVNDIPVTRQVTT